MKNIQQFLMAAISLLLLSSCFSTGGLQKNGSYISYDKVFMKDKNINAVAIVAICTAADKSMYEAMTGKIKDALSLQNISSSLNLLSADLATAAIVKQVKESTQPFTLIINPIKDSYEKDEMNNPFILKQIPCFLQTKTGEHIADFAIRIEKENEAIKTGNENAAVLLEFLKKNNFIR